MHTSTATSSSPASRTKRRVAGPPRSFERISTEPPIVGTRIAGNRFDSEFCPIYGTGRSSCFGELGPFNWFRSHGQDLYLPSDTWTVVSDTCGRMSHFHAVIDDFGNLVAVPR